MPGSSSSNSSFIPKRGTQKLKRRVRNGNLYVLTLFSYIILFTTLVASAGVYVYGEYINGQLQVEISEMNTAVTNFKEAEMQRVQEFDNRLRRAQNRLNNSVSITSIFSAIESATIDSVRFENFKLTRDLDKGFVVQASLETDGFDSSLFQRGVFERNPVVEEVEIDSIVLNESVNESGSSIGQSVSFVANLAVPLSAVPYVVSVNSVSSPIVVTEAPVAVGNGSSDEATVTDSETTGEAESLNQEGI